MNEEHVHTHGDGPAESAEREALSRTVRVHLSVGVALIVLTLWGVSLTALDMDTARRAGIFLGVAFVQGCFIAWILMHLAEEGSPMRRFLGLTLFFAAILVGLMFWTREDILDGSLRGVRATAVHDAADHEEK